jgi:hypothetical protein
LEEVLSSANDGASSDWTSVSRTSEVAASISEPEVEETEEEEEEMSNKWLALPFATASSVQSSALYVHAPRSLLLPNSNQAQVEI